MFFFSLIAWNASRLLLRNMVFWICFVIIIGLIVFLQIMELSDWVATFPTFGEVTIASFFPYIYAVAFSILQVLPLIFLVKPLRGGEERLDSLEVIYTRPESNAEYVWGVAWGYARVFLTMGCIVMLCSMLLHLFASQAPFDLWIYLFYFFTFIVPTFLFALGLCLFVQTFVRRRVLCLTLLLVFWGVLLLFVGDFYQGTFDPVGFSLSAIFSDVLGFPRLGNFLLHRFGWGLLGVGLIQLSVFGFGRLANAPKRRIWVGGSAILIVTLGVLSLTGYAVEFSNRVETREAYIATANEYAGMPRASLLSESLNYRQEGRNMKVTACMELQNQTGKVLDGFVLYLNPDLEVISLQNGDESVEFERENQAIWVEMTLKPEEKVRLTMNYAGGIDEDICYLDVSDNEYFDSQRVKYDVLSRYGKKNAFLEENYTLLIPEVLWYPVATLPYNFKSPYLTSKDFTFYSLNVWEEDDRLVLSQGKSEKKNGYVSFQNKHPLSGISLCIGDYEQRAVMLDSVRCEVNLFKRRSSYFEALSKYCTGEWEDVKSKVEEKMGRPYLFDRFVVVETPVSFVSYNRNLQEGGGYVQPEFVFMPEKFLNMVEAYSANPDGTKDCIIEITNLKSTLYAENSIYNLSWLMSYFAGKDFQQFISSATKADNPYRAVQLFAGLVVFVKDEEYPVLNQVMQFLTKEGWQLTMVDPSFLWNAAEVHAREYLNGRSLKEGLADEKVGLDVQYEMIRLKTQVLSNYFQYKGVEPDTLKQFVRMYLDTHPFQSVDFKQFDADFAARFGLSWFDILPQWYKGKGLPKYCLQDFSYNAVADPGKRYGHPGLVQFTIFNDGGVDGIVKLRYESGGWANGKIVWGVRGEVEEVCYYLKANTGQRVSLFLPISGKYVELDLGFCANLPWKAFCERTREEVGEYQDDVEAVTLEELLPAENEIVVDNEDKGFTISQSEKRLASLQASMQGKHARYDNLYQMAMLDVVWRTLVNHTAYGMVNKSLVTRLAGEGTTSVNWEAELPENGWYEVLVYLPDYMPMQTTDGAVNVLDKGERADLNPRYYKNHYELRFSGEEVRKVELPTYNVSGWISLGCFPSKVGKAKVSLSDKGVVGRQQIIGDAVKWVYLGKDKP